jgi:hypothetical protein
MGAMANRLGIVIDRTVSGRNSSVTPSRLMPGCNVVRRVAIPRGRGSQFGAAAFEEIGDVGGELVDVVRRVE